MKTKAKLNRDLFGTWESCDPTQSSVQHCVSNSKGQYKVAVLDVDDSEQAEVRDVKWDGTRLHYSLHWTSTGRFSKNSLILLAKDKVGLTYTYSDQEILQKRPTSKNVLRGRQGKPNR